MEITQEIMDLVEARKGQLQQMISSNHVEVEDLVQDVYERILMADTDLPNEKLVELVVFSVGAQHSQKERNRRRLEDENSEIIARNTTPTLTDSSAADPAFIAEAEEILRARWDSLSEHLKTIARRSFFGYTESPAKIARDLGTTEAAVNMARTRIKQVMNGDTNE